MTVAIVGNVASQIAAFHSVIGCAWSVFIGGIFSLRLGVVRIVVVWQSENVFMGIPGVDSWLTWMSPNSRHVIRIFYMHVIRTFLIQEYCRHRIVCSICPVKALSWFSTSRPMPRMPCETPRSWHMASIAWRCLQPRLDTSMSFSVSPIYVFMVEAHLRENDILRGWSFIRWSMESHAAPLNMLSSRQNMLTCLIHGQMIP